jgi:hypothetical protein
VVYVRIKGEGRGGGRAVFVVVERAAAEDVDRVPIHHP